MLNPWTVALLLILLPPDSPRVEVGEAAPVHLQALKDVVELLDVLPRHDATWTPNYPHEVSWAQRQQRNVSRYPPLADADRLPSHAEAVAKAEFNERLVERLRVSQLCDSYFLWERWQLLIDETACASTAWWCIARAQDPKLFAADRRKHLDELRWRLGYAAYYAGQWPPHVPLRYFRTEP